MKRWVKHASQAFQDRGYLMIVTVIGAYIGLYTIFEARHERFVNRAAFERATFITMVSSGNRGAFIAAMKDFGPVQTMRVPAEPSFWPPFQSWFVTRKPNEAPLWLWAQHYFPLCTIEACGIPGRTSGSWRIELSGANLERAKLDGINLSRANLDEANLRGASLRNTNLSGANLDGANLEGANLEDSRLGDARFIFANLSNANLSRTVLFNTQNRHPNSR